MRQETPQNKGMQKLRIHISDLHSYVKFRVFRVKTHS